MPSIEYILGFMVGIIAVLIVVLLLKKVFVKNGLFDKCEADERQILARGVAYKVAFYVLLSWNVLGYIVNVLELLEGKWMGHFCFIGLLLGCMIFAIVCIIKDAYLGMAKKPGRVLLGLVVVGVVNLGIGISESVIMKHAVKHPQEVDVYWYNLICGVMLLIVAAVQGIKMWYNRCREE